MRIGQRDGVMLARGIGNNCHRKIGNGQFWTKLKRIIRLRIGMLKRFRVTGEIWGVFKSTSAELTCIEVRLAIYHHMYNDRPLQLLLDSVCGGNVCQVRSGVIVVANLE